jgi:RNA polymerase sigma-70 factor (ECF subfamily)
MLPADVSYERELLQRIAQEDEMAFRALFDLYKERFYATALKMTRSADIAEEIVQEIFVTIWLRRHALAEVEHPTAYLFTMVYHRVHAHFKKLALEKRVKQHIVNGNMDTECNSEDDMARKESQQLLQTLIRQLPAQQQQVYQLSTQEGLSRDEIASRLHISPNTVKNHLQKAVKYIRLHFSRALFLAVAFFL